MTTRDRQKAHEQRIINDEQRIEEINNAISAKKWNNNSTQYRLGCIDSDCTMMMAMGFVETTVLREPALARLSIIEKGQMEYLIDPPTIKELEYVLRRRKGNLRNG